MDFESVVLDYDEHQNEMTQSKCRASALGTGLSGAPQRGVQGERGAHQAAIHAQRVAHKEGLVQSVLRQQCACDTTRAEPACFKMIQ